MTLDDHLVDQCLAQLLPSADGLLLTLVLGFADLFLSLVLSNHPLDKPLVLRFILVLRVGSQETASVVACGSNAH